MTQFCRIFVVTKNYTGELLMTCGETENLLNAYIDGELDSAVNLAVETHMCGCASCLAHGANLKGLAAAIENASLRFKAPARLNRDVRVAICAAKS
jgi:anti-sigma factor RsiW